MEIQVNYLDNLRLEAKFDDFSVISDQPIRYKGEGSAPGPFDYFLVSSAMCAAYFVKVYCNARDIPTENIRLAHNNIVDPENRYKQTFKIQIELPEEISEKDRQGILRSIDRCTVKRVVQNNPDFDIEVVESLEDNAQSLLTGKAMGEAGEHTWIEGKDLPLEQTIANLSGIIADLGIKLEIASWRNIVPNVWSLHLRDAASPQCFTNGKGATKESALCSALGEFIERTNFNFFYNDQFFGEDIAASDFVHYPNERWFPLTEDDSVPAGLLDEHCLAVYDPEGELCGSNLVDTNSGRVDRGIVALPFVRHSDGETVYFPSNLIENLYLSNGMSAGNTVVEAEVQCLSEIIERGIKKRIIEDELALPDIPREVLAKYPAILEGIDALEDKGFPLLVRDASLGGQFPVISITLMNPKTGGAFACFGAHPSFEVALERTLTELMQGRSFEGFNDFLPPTFNSHTVAEPNNYVEHFIDSSGVMSWRFFSNKPDFAFVEWDFAGTTAEETDTLFGMFDAMELEAYVSVREELGAPVCRILVPGFSEVYEVSDLVWDNTNMALDYREDILNLHRLDKDELADLLERLEESQLDEHLDIVTLIGIEFDENTVWGQLTILELQLMLNLALGQQEEALERVEMFLQYNDNTVERELFYQAVQAVLEVELDDELALDDFAPNLQRMFGDATMAEVVGAVQGTANFPGLAPTSMALEGIEKHQRLLESYKKLHAARAERHHC
ncbi:MAG: OsmC domain/YcaO domain-containing protein [Halomonas subglaciescola]|nr:OsmC domain/YcaO domain-containing protein [Halomonas subglaciescola]